ncbi:MAG TPA: hypothetical protein VKV74_07400 [Bryobacteraceae bacterium]|nr:hypothetical protein [Bryobacteraceae bacterium]
MTRLAPGMQELQSMGRYLIFLIALLWLASSAAFFFYVPVLPVLASSLVLIGFALMFLLGLRAGQSRRPS